jgi:malonyl-CoA O-methyltransferase
MDPRRVARRFRRAARTLASADFLYAEIRTRLLERLQFIQLQPTIVVDLGAGTAAGATALAARFPAAQVTAIDLVPELLRSGGTGAALPVCADAARLPLAGNSADLVFASLLLPWCDPLQPVLAETRRVLRFPGLFSFATFGAGTLRELRQAWAAADQFVHVHDYPDMHDLGDMLVATGFAEPVVECETLTITYPDVARLAGELQAMGASSLSAARNQGLTGRGTWARMRAAYESRRGEDGRITATVEVIYGQAWVPDPAGRRQAGNKEFAIPVGRIRRAAPPR